MSQLDDASLNQLYRYSIAITANKADAEDVLQTGIERYLKLCDKPLSDCLPLVRKIMRNYWFDELRKMKTRQSYVEESQSSESISMLESSLEDVCISQHDLANLWTSLSDQQRELLYLYGVLDYTAQEIAEEQGIPRGSVLSRVHRLKKSLQKIYQDLKISGGKNES